MTKFLDFWLKLLSQFAGGPGPMENNLVRFGLPAILWGALLAVAWSRQRQHELPREKLLVWGFGLGFGSQMLMAGFVALQMLEIVERDVAYVVFVPLERALAMASIVVVAGAFLRYILDDARLARRYIQIGLGITILCLLIAYWQWPHSLAIFTDARLHETWDGWLFHVPLTVLIVVAILLLLRARGWLRNVVAVALTLFFLSGFLNLVNYATDRNYSQIVCPIGNSLYILAIPLLAYVYLREQAIEKRRAEKALEAYREHLEDLVKERTAELNQEIFERKQAEGALAKLSRRNELILESAGEGICGIDGQGRFMFLNPAAVRMLGYRVEELIGRPSHAILHHSRADHSPYPEEECPIYAGYRHGVARHGEDQAFWRKDGTSFPALYVSNPTYEDGTLTGAVVVFRDITERKQAEAEIAQRSIRLAAQNAVAATLSQSLDLETILNTALDMVLSVLEMEAGLVFLLDPDGETLVLQIYRGRVSLDEEKESLQEQGCCRRISSEAVTAMRATVHAVSDYPAEDRSSFIAKEGLQMLVSTPLVSKGRAVGVITLGSRRADAIQQPELELLTAIGQQIGMAIENARLYQTAGRRAEELALLHQVSIFLTSTLDSARIYDQIAEQSAKLLGCPMACILNWDEQCQRVEMISSYGLDESEVEILQTQLVAPGLLPDLAAQQQSVAIEDARTDPRVPAIWRERLEIQALLCLPIWGTEGVLGLLFLMDRRASRRWGPEDLKLIESFVSRAAVALVNAHLHEQLEWAVALEERQRIAADMHDGLAQTVSLLGLQLDQATQLASAGSGQNVAEKLNQMREIVGQVSVDVRRSIASLQETPTPRRSLQDLLSDLSEQLPLADGPVVELTSEVPEPLFLPPEQRAQALPVVQEALLNAWRHAQAQRIDLLLERQGDKVRITVKDDGRGFDQDAARRHREGHFGLRIMRARTARMGGRLQVHSAPGQGTRVILTWVLDGDGSKAVRDSTPPVSMAQETLSLGAEP